MSCSYQRRAYIGIPNTYCLLVDDLYPLTLKMVQDGISEMNMYGRLEFSRYDEKLVHQKTEILASTLQNYSRKTTVTLILKFSS